ncbi:MAG: thiosulfate oxidation carrier protein SoxY [Betaproteobacteria bacterium HGW-Betaproteobacteria-20]|jgi:sulfur-oxidizing protein SoxY|nr:MAG: thiosulfate oxidation carrier protein SoxY [Betaproteobacteria bacterium HGW-Betaproteobacteria-20]
MQRRNFLTFLLGGATALLVIPLQVLSAVWNRAAFETTKLDEATKNLSIDNEIVSLDIQIIAPDKAENGAVVPVEVRSHIANTEAIAILVEKNPTPLIANFMFSHGAEPFVVTRIKMAETDDIKIIVKAGNQYFTNSKNIIVLENGCG